MHENESIFSAHSAHLCFFATKSLSCPFVSHFVRFVFELRFEFYFLNTTLEAV